MSFQGPAGSHRRIEGNKMIRYLHILLAIAAEPLAIEREKLSAILTFLALKAEGGDVAAEDVAKITQKGARETAKAPGQVGVLSILGVLGQRMNMMDDISGPGGTSTQLVTQQFRSMVENDAIKAIILDFDSPGGQVFGIEELGNELFNSRGIKPIVAQVNSTAASAAFWLATQADEIVVTPGGRAGSIGVYTIHDDISKMLEMKGVTSTVIASHPNKILGNEFEPLSEQARAVIEERVAISQRKFDAAVARGRNVSVAKVRDRMGNGLTFGAEELIDRGMADRIGTLDDTLERFGVQVRPAAVRDRQHAALARKTDADVFVKALKAGEPLQHRQIRDGLRGLIPDLSKADAERAVSVIASGLAQGDPAPRETTDNAEAIRAQLSSIVGGLTQLRGLIPKLKP